MAASGFTSCRFHTPRQHRHHIMKTKNGFTLLELLVALTIACILMVLAMPSFADFIRGTRLTSTVNELVGTLHYARSEAIKRNTSIMVKTKIPAQWESGWTVELLPPCVSDCILRTHEPLPINYTLRLLGKVGDSIFYHASGASEENLQLVLCEGSIAKVGYIKAITINYVGTIKIATDKNNNGLPEIGGVDVSSCT